MSCFDTVHFTCTCGWRIKIQSKSGPCECGNFFANKVPVDIATDIINSHITCVYCNTKWKIVTQKYVAMTLEKENESKTEE